MLVDTDYFHVDVESTCNDKKYTDLVYKIALTQTKSDYDAADVFQEVFMRLAENHNKITSDEHLKHWLIRVTLNCSKKHFRMWMRNSDVVFDDNLGLTSEEHDIFYAVQELPPNDRIVIHLFYYESLPIKEISRILNTKEATVKSRLSRAREKLRNVLVEEL